jgi:hypothetical protein
MFWYIRRDVSDLIIALTAFSPEHFTFFAKKSALSCRKQRLIAALFFLQDCHCCRASRIWE